MFEKYFGYSSPSDMYKTLNKTRTTEENKAQVNEIENRLTTLIKMLEIVERILYFNLLNQAGEGLNVLTPNQILSRLPICWAQLSWK